MKRWALPAVLALALGLRLFAIGWGLPDFHHPDEQYILNRALAFAKGSINPHNFLYPTLYFYALFVWEGAFFVLGRVSGVYHSVAAFERDFFVDPTRLVIAGRALTAMFGVATVGAVYVFGKRLYDSRVGLGAALLLAVAPFAVRDAHYIKLDVPVTLFVVLCQASLARILVDPAGGARKGAWLAAGAFAGLALSTQYYVFPIILSIIVVATIHAQRTQDVAGAFRLLLLAGVASVAGFLAGSPFFFSDVSITIRDMREVFNIDVNRAVAGHGAFTSVGAYVSMLATDAMGLGVAVAAVVCLVVAFAFDRGRAILLACFPIAFFVFLANTVPMTRYLNPLLPSLAVAAAFVASRVPRRAAIVAVLLALPGLHASIRADLFYRQADTRTQAREFIERNVPNGASILVQPHSVQLASSREALVESLRAHLGSESAATVKFQKQLDAAPLVAHTYRVFYVGRVTDNDVAVDKMYVAPADFDGAAGLEPLRARHVTYVALNRYNTDSQVFRSLYAALQREAVLVATFSPYKDNVDADRRLAVPPFFHNTDDRIDPALERPGPTISVWRID